MEVFIGIGLFLSTSFAALVGAIMGLPKKLLDAGAGTALATAIWSTLIFGTAAVITKVFLIQNGWIVCGIWTIVAGVLGYLIERIFWARLSPERAYQRIEKSLDLLESQKQKTQMGAKVCSGCGRTESKILSDFDTARKQGIVVIGSGGSGLLYCDNCKKYFCGRCQVDLGWNSGCPVCRKALD